MKKKEAFPTLLKQRPQENKTPSLSEEIERLKAISSKSVHQTESRENANSESAEPIMRISVDVPNNATNEEKLSCLQDLERLSQEKEINFKMFFSSNFTRLMASVPLSLLPAIAAVVDPMPVATLGPAVSDSGRGEQLISFTSRTPTYRDLYRALQLTKFRVFPVLSANEWDELRAQTDGRIRERLRVLSGNPVWQSDFKHFDKVLFGLTSLSFSVQNATLSFAKSYGQHFVVTDLLNQDRVFAFTATGGTFTQDDAYALSKQLVDCPSYLGYTCPRWRRPPPGVHEPAKQRYCFYFACSEETPNIELVTKTVYEFLGNKYTVGDGDTKLLLLDLQNIHTPWKTAQENIRHQYGVVVPWSCRGDTCLHCGSLHRSTSCPYLIVPSGIQDMIERVVKAADDETQEILKKYEGAHDPAYFEFISNDMSSKVLEKENISVPRRHKELKKKPVQSVQLMKDDLKRKVDAFKPVNVNQNDSENLNINPHERSDSNEEVDSERANMDFESNDQALNAETPTDNSWTLVTRRSSSAKRRRPLRQL
jgi:hypothetical protein